MNIGPIQRRTFLGALATALFVLIAASHVLRAQNVNSAFLGQWCAQGDPSKVASISANGPKHVTANWNGQTINGALVNNAGRINWDNGTWWSR